MQALSLSQPWAWAVVNGHRPIENRMEPSVAQAARDLIGKDVALHANLSWRAYAKEKLQDAGIVVPMKVALPAGAAVGVATIKAVCKLGDLEHHLDGAELAAVWRWATGPWCIVFANPRPLAKALKTPQRGGSWGGFWPLPYDVERKVLEQLGEAS